MATAPLSTVYLSDIKNFPTESLMRGTALMNIANSVLDPVHKLFLSKAF